jgi:sortase A
MRRVVRTLGAVMVVGGVLTLAWAMLVWQWEDPFTALYTKWKQHQLAQSYDRLLAQYRPPALKHGMSLAAEERGVREAAAAYRAQMHRGQAIGRIVIGRIGLNMILVNGTDHGSLTKGPGRDLRTFMPGQNRLVYIAGHRTTYLAPFSHIDRIRPGDYVELDMPYGRFTYRAYTHRIVAAGDLSVLKSPKHELLELQACHPRFFATHRYIVYAKLVGVQPRGGGRRFAPATVAAGRQ